MDMGNLVMGYLRCQRKRRSQVPVEEEKGIRGLARGRRKRGRPMLEEEPGVKG